MRLTSKNLTRRWYITKATGGAAVSRAVTQRGLVTQGSPTFLNVGRGVHDPARFAVGIFGQLRVAFLDAPEDIHGGKTIVARGPIGSYAGVSQIILDSLDNITAVEERGALP